MNSDSPIINPLFRKALQREPQNLAPVWFMRQAGRYHQHYQNLRAQHSFMELCKRPELAAEVALGPVKEFDFDVSILFSDILFPLEALGMGLEYTEQGPQLGFCLTPENIKKLKPASEAIQDLAFQKLALEATRQVLPKNKSLIGFIGGPWTLFGYASEGSHKGGLTLAKKNMALLPAFFEILMPLLIENIRLQFAGGAEVVMIFDTAAGELSPHHFKNWIQKHLIELAKLFPGKLGYYSKGTHSDYFSQEMMNAPWAGWGFDHRWNLNQCFSFSSTGFVQGNFDQSLLHLESAQLQKELHDYLEPLKILSPAERAGWVSGLGHGVLPKTPEKNIHLFIDMFRKAFA